MTDSIVHRGPDGEGLFFEENVGLGHRRLAIIDLTPAGDQPMKSLSGRFVISYNGEIYNYQETRVELELLGHQFQSQSDTEVLINAWEEWGEESLNRFNGMFAFALWDRKNHELILARDRYGIKPLYYALCGAELLFGSEVKAFLDHPAFAADVDKAALLEYFTFQNQLTDRTLFKGVKILPAGCLMRMSAREVRKMTPRRYWDFNFVEPEQAADEAEYIEELDRLFKQAVKRQLVSDVELGSYLSGGMDSGSIAAIAASQLPYLKTFCVGFDLRSASGIELAYDEREKAEHMSYLFRTEHYEMVLKSGDMERVMPRLAWHLDEPRVGQSYPNYYAAGLAGKFVKVVLSGAGGDELFGGYPWRYYRAVVNDDFEHYIDKYYLYWQRLIPNKIVRKVFEPIWRDVEDIWTRDIFRDVFDAHSDRLTRPEDYINHSLYFEAKTFLHGLLVVEDKLSMAHGLETRVPFLDNDLVDFAMRVPAGLKLGNLGEVVRLNENEPGSKTERYFRKTQDGKLLLRKMMERNIPKVITEREKQGFSAPDASWFRGESMEYLRNLIYESDAMLYQFLDRKCIQHLVEEHINGDKNRRLLIWSLLNFENWCRTFLTGETALE